jgi:hypothetical protein
VHLNLQSHLPDGRAVLTRIRPGTQPGVLLNMVKELPGATQFEDYIPLSRVQVFSTKDNSMSLNIFVFGEEKMAPTHVEQAGAQILDYATKVQLGQYVTDDRHPKPSPLFERERIIDYLHNCSETYINALTRADPRRFLRQMELFDRVSGTEGMAVIVEVSYRVVLVSLLCVFENKKGFSSSPCFTVGIG